MLNISGDHERLPESVRRIRRQRLKDIKISEDFLIPLGRNFPRTLELVNTEQRFRAVRSPFDILQEIP